MLQQSYRFTRLCNKNKLTNIFSTGSCCFRWMWRMHTIYWFGQRWRQRLSNQRSNQVGWCSIFAVLQWDHWSSKRCNAHPPEYRHQCLPVYQVRTRNKKHRSKINWTFSDFVLVSCSELCYCLGLEWEIISSILLPNIAVWD